MTKSFNLNFWCFILVFVLGSLFVSSRGSLVYAAETESTDGPIAISDEFTGGIASTQVEIIEIEETQFTTLGDSSGPVIDGTTSIISTPSTENSFQTLGGSGGGSTSTTTSVSVEGSFQTLATPIEPPVNPSGGGGGSNSGGGSGGYLAIAPVTRLPGACPVYLLKFIKFGEANDPVEVAKLQAFLHNYEGFSNLAITGSYDEATLAAVMIFQVRYKEAVLTPWGIDYPTGYVYITTTLAINNLYCERDPANDLVFKVKTGQLVLPQVATSTTATTTLPEVGSEKQPFWLLAALGFWDFLSGLPCWFIILFFLILILWIVGLRDRDKDDIMKK
ncbi:MAG: peptidoglycan-binding domain-containing protein [Patescibacteria group bacterium]